MEHRLMEYSFQYLEDIYHDENNHSYEKYKLIDKIDNEISQHTIEYNYLYHITPILYSVTFFLGVSTFIYKIYVS